MSSHVRSSVSEQLDRVLVEHRAGHFDVARKLLSEIPVGSVETAMSDEEMARYKELRGRFQPDWFGWLMLIGGLLLLGLTVAAFR